MLNDNPKSITNPISKRRTTGCPEVSRASEPCPRLPFGGGVGMVHESPNSGVNSRNQSVDVRASIHTIGCMLAPSPGFEAWLTGLSPDSHTFQEKLPYWTKETWSIKGLGFFTKYTPESGVSSYKVFTETPEHTLPIVKTQATILGFDRIDIALDYDADLSGCEFVALRFKYHARFGLGKKLETLTFGRRGRGGGEKRTYRIYNKGKCGGTDRWRIEVQYRPDNVCASLPDNLFDPVSIFYFPPVPAEGMSMNDQAMLYFCHYHPAAEQSLHYGAKKRLQENRDKYLLQVLPQPNDAYRLNQSALMEVLSGIESDLREIVHFDPETGEVLDDAPLG